MAKTLIMIVIDFDTLDFSISNQLTGEIYLDIEDSCFPDRHWNDFIAIIVGWWLDSLHLFIENNSSNEVTLDFMDGPFQFNIKKNCQNWTVILMKRDSILNTYIIDNPIDFLKEFLIQINKLLKICNESKWTNTDIQKLDKKYRLLKKGLKSNEYFFFNDKHRCD